MSAPTRRALFQTALALPVAGLVQPARAVNPHEHALRDEHSQLRRRAQVLLAQLGLSRRVEFGFDAMFSDPRWRYADDGAGRMKAVADMNAALAHGRTLLAPAFGALAIPPAQIAVLSDADIARGKRGYRLIAQGGAPATYFVDLSHIAQRPAFTLPSAAYHEAVPGHLLALNHPPRAKPPPAFVEGWPIYAEWLMVRLGAFVQDPAGELGAIHWRLFRLNRALADIAYRKHGARGG
ncbi:MAG: DUF885 family protein, partial [Alphaproteobacteria bacterium]|nr:DUF885 family protein [Alphaproteobacteria bacterium]